MRELRTCGRCLALETDTRGVAQRRNPYGGSSIRIYSHHITPRKYGGTDNKENLVDLCGGCHGVVHSEYMEKALAFMVNFDPNFFTNIMEKNRAVVCGK